MDEIDRIISVDETQDQGMELFTQDGVLLKSAAGRSVNDLNTTGSLSIVAYSDGSKFIEWKPNDLITIDSEIQDQEWAVVNTVGRRTRTFSGNPTASDLQARSRINKLPLNDLVSFRVTKNSQQILFSDKHLQTHSSFFFQHGNADIFINILKSHVKTVKSRHDRNTYIVVEQNNETNVLNKSFAELDIFTENTTDIVWNLVSNFKQRPYATTMEAFSKLTDIVYYGNETPNGKRCVDEEVADLLTKSMSAMEDATTVLPSEGYEVINVKPTLPPRPSIPRGTPLSPEQWAGLQDAEGRITEVEGVKQIIFRGGVCPSIRHHVWKYLLNYFPWEMTNQQRAVLQKKNVEEYFSMKLQWRSMTVGQENRFSDFQNRKSLVEKDVNRTDRCSAFYAGDNNPNLVTLYDILMTYVMYNFDLGYVQGMSDILSPILCLLGNEVDSFWCFVGFMDKIALNFDMDQAGMKNQLVQLHTLLSFTNPTLATYLTKHDSGNMFFCFRWMLVWFKREFSHYDIMRLWEVLWTGLPCVNFHLLICVAILDTEKDVLMGNNYGFTEILKHVNDLSMRIDLEEMLRRAEGIYHQICAASHLTDSVRVILGMEPLQISMTSGSECQENDDVVTIPSTSSQTATTNGHHSRESPAPVIVPETKGITKTVSKQSSVMLEADADEVVYQIGLDTNYL